MSRTVGIVLALAVATALFVGLVYAVLLAGHVAEAGATTVYGLTMRRLWASTAALLALVGVISGGLALARRGSRVSSTPARGATLAIAGGLLAAVNGALNVAVATGGPGTGNGVVGGAAAFVLGIAALALGALALARGRHTTVQRRQLT